VGAQVVELLDVVEAHLLGRGLLDRTQPGREVVDERHIGDRPGALLQGLPVAHRDGGRFVMGEDTPGQARDVVGVDQAQQDLARIDLRPPGRHELVDIARGVEGVQEVLALSQAHRFPGGLGQGLAGLIRGEIVRMAAQHPLAQPGQLGLVEPDGMACNEGAEDGRGTLWRPAGGTSEQPPDAQAALDRRHLGVVHAGRGHPVDEVPQGAQRNRVLAQAGQDPLDVCRVGRRRSHHEDPTTLETAALRVEQVCRAVQRHHRLAGAGTTADLDDSS